jgi:hypothetical protein
MIRWAGHEEETVMTHEQILSEANARYFPALTGTQSIQGRSAATEFFAMRVKQKPPDVTFLVWAVIILVGLALLSVAVGVAPLSEPGIFNGP